MIFAAGARIAQELWRAWDSLGPVHDGSPALAARCILVHADTAGVVASAYLRRDREGAVIAVASWAVTNATVALKIDWTAIGLDAASSTITIPNITTFQISGFVGVQKPVVVLAATRGLLLDIWPKKLYG